MPNVYTFKDFEGSSHRILMKLIRRWAPRGGTLLDLGAAGGELGSALRDHFDRTIGFEFNVDCVGTLGGHFDQVVITDLETVRALPSNVDVIVLADVLEHLRNPAAALQLVRRALARRRPRSSSPSPTSPTSPSASACCSASSNTATAASSITPTCASTPSARSAAKSKTPASASWRCGGSSVPIRLIIGSWTPEPILRIGERLLTWLTRVWRGLFAYQIILVAEKK